MCSHKTVSWILRIGVAGEFLGHGMLAIQGKAQWIGWIEKFLSVNAETATTLLLIIGIMDVLVAAIVLARPWRPVLLWAAIWGFWTALLRPIMGESFWDFIERFANFAAPLALWLLLACCGACGTMKKEDNDKGDCCADALEKK